MQQNRSPIRSIFLLVWPVFVYKIVYAIYIIYYSHPEIQWHRVAITGMSVGAFCSLWITGRYLRSIQWDSAEKHAKKGNYYSLFLHAFILVLYVFGILTQIGDDGPLLLFSFRGDLMIVLMGLPPIMAFIDLLISERH